MRFPFLPLLYMSLTPLLGATVSLAGGLLLGLSWVLLLLAQAPLQHGLGGTDLPLRYKVALAALANLVLVFLLDLTLYAILRDPYLPYQFSLRLLAFNPALLLIASDQRRTTSFPETLVFFGKVAFTLLTVSALAGLVREGFGLARLSPWPGVPSVEWTEIAPWTPRFFVGPSGGFLVMLVVGLIFHKLFEHYRPTGVTSKAAPPRPQPEAPQPAVMTSPSPRPEPPPAPTEAAPVPPPPPTPEPPASPTERPDLPWGESEDSLLADLTRQRPFDKKRILVIGSGTGEQVYELAIRLLTLYRNRGQPNFRIRGIDTFQTRIETAREGIYRESLLPHLTDEQKTRYLLRYKHEEARLVKIAQEPRLYVEFLNADFLSPNIFFQKPADLVILNTELDYLPLPKLVTLFAQIRANLHPDGAVLLRFDVPRDAWGGHWRKTGNQVLRKQR